VSTRNPKVINGMYYGKMSEGLANDILGVINKDKIESFRDTIFDFPDQLMIDALTNEISIRDYLKSKGRNAKEYVRQLRDGQTVASAFMYLSNKSVLCDGVGLGKTVVLGSLLNILKAKGEITRFIIAVETSAVNQTVHEIMRRTGLLVLNVPPTKAKMEKFLYGIDWDGVDGIVITHSSLKSDTFSSWLADTVKLVKTGGVDVTRSGLFNTLVIDESSVIKNRDTKIFSYTENIARLMTRVHHLNATPFETAIMDIYNQVDLLDEYILPKKWRVDNRYCVYRFEPYWIAGVNGAEQKNRRVFNKYRDTDHFKKSLRLFVFGRYIEDVKNIYQVHYVYPTLDQSLAITRGLRYQEVLNCPSLVEDEEGLFNNDFSVDTVPKLDYLVDLCRKNKDKKIMIYVFNRDSQRVISEILTADGRTCVVLNGSVTDTNERQDIIDDFNENDADIIITNAKRSLNLYDGDMCILYDVESNPAKLEQIRGRIERNVDDKVKTYVMLVYKGTPEYALFHDKLVTRGKHSKQLVNESKTAIDYFMEGEHFNE